jgi:hypothetical protein
MLRRGSREHRENLPDDEGAAEVRTDDLIRVLAIDHARPADSFMKRFAQLTLLGLVGAGCLFGVLLKPRADLITAIATPRVAFKFLVTLALAGAAGALALRLARPEFKPHIRSALVPTLALLATGVAAELVLTAPTSWGRQLVGSNALACLSLVPLLSVPFLVAALIGLRHGAPADPARAGAIAGLFAGGLGAALYALHCVDDSPLFVAAWYGLAVVAVAALGAAVGARVLRW